MTVTPDAAVVARVSTLAASTARPALTEAEVVATIRAHPRVDADGLTADVEGWTPTWNVYAAVAELWSIKAGKVAGDFNFTADDAQYGKGDVMAHCLAMEQKYAGMCAGSASTARFSDPLSGVVVNG